MSKVASELINCSNRFNDPDFAGSMRFAICMERMFGIDKWIDCCKKKFNSLQKSEYKENNKNYYRKIDLYNDENEPFIESWRGGLHSMPPKYEIPDGIVGELPSFHKMN